MTISYDFDEAAEGGQFITLPEGRFVFKLTKAEAGKSGAGNPKAVITLSVTGSAKDDDLEGSLITQHWPTKGKASFRFRDFLSAIGFDPKKKGKLDLRKFYGTEIGAIVTLRAGDEGDMVFNDLKGIVPGDQMRALLGLDDEEPEDEDFDEDEEEEAEEAEEDEEEEEEEEEEEDHREEDEEEITKADLKSMDIDEMKELAEEWDVSTRKPRGKNLTKVVMRKRLEAYIDSLEEEEDEEDENEEPF